MDVESLIPAQSWCSGVVVFEQELRFLPILLSFFRRIQRKIPDPGAEQVFKLIAPGLIAIFKNSHRLVMDIRHKYPELLDVLLRTWRNLLDTLHARYEDGSTVRNECISGCAAIASTIIDLGGCTMRRRALRKHLLRLFIDTGISLKVTGADVCLFSLLTNMITRYRAYFVHLSVLAPALRELEKMEIQMLTP